MLFSSSILAITLASGTALPAMSDSSFINECVICQQETVYMPEIPNPEMTFSTEPIVREIALAPDDSALTYYVPLETPEQLPSKTDIFRLIEEELQKFNFEFRIKDKGAIVDVYPSSHHPNHYWSNQGMLATDRKVQNGADNKIESLKPTEMKTKKEQQRFQTYTI